MRRTPIKTGRKTGWVQITHTHTHTQGIYIHVVPYNQSVSQLMFVCVV